MSLVCMYCGKSGTALVAAEISETDNTITEPGITLIPISTVGSNMLWKCFDAGVCARRQRAKETPVNENAAARDRLPPA